VVRISGDGKLAISSFTTAKPSSKALRSQGMQQGDQTVLSLRTGGGQRNSFCASRFDSSASRSQGNKTYYSFAVFLKFNLNCEVFYQQIIYL
jgi:hypothetical protein